MQQSHSRYWLDADLFDKDKGEDAEVTDLGRIIRLAAARRAVANFVNILTNRNDLNVRFSSGKESSTNGTDIIIAADDNPDHFDSMVGLALHEASHVLLTDFTFLKYINPLRTAMRHLTDETVQYYRQEDGVERSSLRTQQRTVGIQGRTIPTMEHLVHPVLRTILQKHRDADNDQLWHEGAWRSSQDRVEQDINAEWAKVALRMFGDLHNIMNILEDRRIDAYVYRTAAGYRPYYKALYDRYFFTKETGNNLRYNPEWREVKVENYINRLLLMFHPDNTKDALPGLAQVYAMVDLPNIDRIDEAWTPPTTAKAVKYKDTPALWQLANRLYVQMLRYAAVQPVEQDEYVAGGSILDDFTEKERKQLFGDLPDLDMGDMQSRPVEQTPRGKEGKFNAEKAERELQKALDATNGEMKKKKAKKSEADQAAALEQADAQIVDLKGEGIPFGKCMVIRKLTDSVFMQEWFPFKRWNWQQDNPPAYLRNSVSAGKRMGQILAHRLQVRNDPMLTKQTRLPHGGLDRRLLAQLGMEITSVFQKSRVDIHRPVMLHLTLDASGSMHGPKWEKVMTVATALAYLGEKVRNVDVVISLRGGHELPMVCIMHDSRKNSFPNFVRHALRVEPNGGTPEGLCYKATMGLITENAATHDVYFINFSDGEPTWSIRRDNVKRHDYNGWFHYSGEVAVNHTRRMVREIQEHGVKVLSYFISGGTGTYEHYSTGSGAVFRKMYGESAAFVNVSNAGEVLRTLNKLLLVRG